MSNRISNLLAELESAIPDVDPSYQFGAPVERHDWRPVWAICKKLQDEFKNAGAYLTRTEQQRAWTEFQALRVRASELQKAERSNVEEFSSRMRAEIIEEARACYWSKSSDFLLGAVLGETTRDEMLELQARLKTAGQKLSENKEFMLREDKEACFQTIKDSRESHDRFWEKYKEYQSDRRAAAQARREAFERKRAEWIDRVTANVERNREKLSRAVGALEKTQDRIDELKEKIRETNSPKWEGIYSEWLSEALDKASDIEVSIARIMGWIEEDLAKLRDASTR